MVRSDSLDDKIVTKPKKLKNTKSKRCVLISVDSLSKVSVNFTEIQEFRDVIFVVKHFWNSVNWESIQDLCFGILMFATDLQNPGDIVDIETNDTIQVVLEES